MTYRFLLALLFMATVVAPTTSMAQATVFGGADCGQWFNTQKNPSARLWLTGYLSGLNAALAKGGVDPLNKLNSMEQAYLWMNNYCKENPLKGIQGGANVLYRELQAGPAAK